MLAERRPVAALREAGRLGAWSLVDRRLSPGPEASRRLATALGPRALAGLGPDAPIALALLALTEGSTAVETWMDRLALAPARRDAIRHARRDAPGLVARLARARGRAAAYGILQSVPELTVAWARTLAGGAAAPEPSRPPPPKLATLAPTPGAGDGRRRRRAGRPPGPAVGEILKGLRAAQAAGHVRSRAGALRWLTGAVAPGRGRGKASLTRPGKGGG